ncbi:hypothetical protein ACSS6W_004895 [Trichoderma asperelloides]|uniref:Uncharacterized protein YLL056C n=1 Tax=Trichoderma asperellum TaxID=101201 RepID=A0A6V8QXS5_TRIAP|nr:hypothetical protein LI328DRAFT_132971 [Trichoderma asperelloides]GFP56616.1 uncharacterized protein YLL056C [Trichoderma asperellum]
MAVKVFLTGVTGYVGGTVFDHVYNAHKDYEYTVLVRDEARAQLVKAKYPTAKFAYGALEDTDVIEKAAAEADIVIHTADSSDHAISARAIAKGLKEGHTAEKPGYWLHLSGTAILTWYDHVNNRAGEGPHPEYIYNDLDGVDRMLNFPDDGIHRDVDKIIQNAASDAVKPTIICPPLIYGKGSGVGNQKSVQLPYLIEAGLSDGYVPVVKPGKTEWDHVDVHSLGDLYLKLVDATQDPLKNNNPEIFGIRGFFFAASGTHSFLQLAEKVVEEIKKQGYSNKVTVKQYSLAELRELKGDNLIIHTYAFSSRGEAQRAKKYLGWEPKGMSIAEGVAETVDILARAKGL